MDIKIETQINQALITCQEMWENTKNCFAEQLVYIPIKEKKKNETRFEDSIKQLKKHIQKFPSVLQERKKWKKDADKFLKKMLSNDNLLGMKKMEESTRQNFFDMTKLFIRKTRKFDPELKLDDIFQALRNYFIYFMLVEQKGETASVHDAIWSYSLLYPYTDNFLDNPEISNEDKKEFNHRLYKRLKGYLVSSKNPMEEKINQLISLIEANYPRKEYPDVYECILLIFQAQIESLKQQSDCFLSEKELLDISIFKGASSVLVDGCFIHGKLTEKDISFLSQFGYFLQLADDLQDIETDNQSNHQTLFTKQSEKGYLDLIANQLFDYLDCIFIEHDGIPEMQEFIKENCSSLVLSAILENKKYFSQSYIEQIEKYFLVSASFLDKSKIEINDLEKEKINFIEILDELISDN